MGTSNFVKKKRIFICTDTDYPKLDAASNYVANMAKSLGMAGLDVYLISLDRSCSTATQINVEWGKADLFSYVAIPHCIVNKVETLKSRILCGRKMISLLEQMKCSKDDVLITYLYKAKTNNDIVSWAKKKKIDIYATVVEWFEGKFREQEKCFAQYGRCSGVIAISRNIEEYFKRLGLKTMILPPMVDMSQKSLKVQSSNNKINFLYTGNFVGKDDMRVMLEALALLSDDMRSTIEFHVTRFDSEALKKAAGINEEIWNIIKDVVIAHGEVTVDELGRLLMNADYLPIARQVNRTTISNFPSKVPEAMAFGIVPIMTLVGDCANDYLTDGVDSILFDECTPECCAKAFERAVSIACDEDGKKYLELRKEAYNIVVRRFDIVNYSSQLAEFLF